MNRVKIAADRVSVLLDCPFCDNWESLGIDDPRKRLNSLPIIEWLPDKKGQNEISTHECTLCSGRFEVEWDYNNSSDIDLPHYKKKPFNIKTT